jgi:hypothetical protein
MPINAARFRLLQKKGGKPVSIGVEQVENNIRYEVEAFVAMVQAGKVEDEVRQILQRPNLLLQFAFAVCALRPAVLFGVGRAALAAI